MELGSYFCFCKNKKKDIIIITGRALGRVLRVWVLQPASWPPKMATRGVIVGFFTFKVQVLPVVPQYSKYRS
jgi:hypothetical protein